MERKLPTINGKEKSIREKCSLMKMSGTNKV